MSKIRAFIYRIYTVYKWRKEDDRTYILIRHSRTYSGPEEFTNKLHMFAYISEILDDGKYELDIKKPDSLKKQELAELERLSNKYKAPTSENKDHEQS